MADHKEECKLFQYLSYNIGWQVHGCLLQSQSQRTEYLLEDHALSQCKSAS